MLGQVHEHIVRELGEGSRTDTIFVLTAIVFNLIVLAVNSGLASEAVTRGGSATYDTVLVVFIVMTVLLNVVALVALILGRRTRRMFAGRAGGDVSGQRGCEVLRSVADVELRNPVSALRGGDRDAGVDGDRGAVDYSVYELGLGADE